MDGFTSRTNRADSSRGKIAIGPWRFEGELIFAFLLALLLSLALAMTFSRKGYGLPLSLSLGSLPVVLCLIWIVGFKQGKPPGYDLDFLDRLWQGSHWQPDFNRQPLHPRRRFQHDSKHTFGLRPFGRGSQ